MESVYSRTLQRGGSTLRAEGVYSRPFKGEEAYTLDPSKGRRCIHLYIYYIYTCSGWLRPFQRGGGLPRIVSQSCTHTVLHKIRSCYEEAY